VLENLADQLAISLLVVAEDEHEDAGKDARHQSCPAEEASGRIPLERADHLALRRGCRAGQKGEMGEEARSARHRQREDRGGWQAKTCGESPLCGQRRNQRRHSAQPSPARQSGKGAR